MEAGSSKGWIVFFLVKRIARGRLREYRSVRITLVRAEAVVLLRNRVVFGFSMESGARLAIIRAVRADLGLLDIH